MEPWFAALVDEALACAQNGEVCIPVEVVIDLGRGREFYREYVEDVASYRDNGDLDPTHPDQGYATGVPYTEGEYLRDYVLGVVDDALGTSMWHSFRGAAASQDQPQ